MYKYIITWVLTQWVNVPCDKTQDFLGRDSNISFSVNCEAIQSTPKMFVTENKIQARTTFDKVRSARNIYNQNQDLKNFVQDINDKTISISNVTLDSIAK